MDDRVKTHQILYDDGLIVTDQPNLPEAVIVGPQQQYYQPQSVEQPQKQYYPSQSPVVAPFSDKTSHQPPSEYPPIQGLHATGPRSIWKRKSTWIVVALVVALAVLAGVLGGVLAAKAKTTPAESGISASTTSSAISTSSTPKPSVFSASPTTSSNSAPTRTNPAVQTATLKLPNGTVITRECPSADGLDYNYVNKKGVAQTFKRYCDTNFPNGDIGLARNTTIRNMPGCIEECGNTDFCVGAIWNNNGECWLKNAIRGRETDLVFGTESAVLQE